MNKKLNFIVFITINIILLNFISNLNFNKELIVNNITYINEKNYQADVIDNFSRVFLRAKKINITDNLCNLNICEYSYHQEVNKIQFISYNPRSISSIKIGNGDFRVKKSLLLVFFIIEISLITLFLIRNKIKYYALKIRNDIKFDLNTALNNLGIYKYLLYLYIIFNFILILNTNFNDIIVWDEAVYLNTGRDLVDKLELWPYARGPLIQLFYAFFYLIITLVGFDQNWLLTLSILGKLFCFFLTIIMLIVTSNRLSYTLERSIYKPELFISSAIIFYPVANLVNPSYSIYTLVFSFVFYFLILAIQTSERIYYLLLSILLGFLGLVRPDVLIILPLISVAIYFTSTSPSRRIDLIYILIPGLFLIYGYQLFIYLATGVYETGSMKKLYLAFESAESLNLQNKFTSFIDWYNGARNLAEQTYGSANENHNNIFIAILNNPIAFLNRELLTLKMLPGALAEGYTFFNISSAYLVLYIFILSFIFLFRKSKKLFYTILSILSHLSLYFITLIYSSYLLLDFPIFCLLFSIFFSYIINSKIYSKLLLLFMIIISLYFDVNNLLIVFLLLLLAINYETKYSIGFKFNYNSISRYVGVSIFLYGIVIASLVSNYKLPKLKYTDVSEYVDIYAAKRIASKQCNDGNLISQTYSFPIFSKITFLPIDSDLISNLNNIPYLTNQKIVSCIFVDKIMREQNPMNILQGINKLIVNNDIIELYKSDRITLYRLK